MKPLLVIFLLLPTLARCSSIVEWNFSNLTSSQMTNSTFDSTVYQSDLLANRPAIQRECWGFSNDYKTFQILNGCISLDDAILSNSYFEFTLQPTEQIQIHVLRFNVSKYGGSSRPGFLSLYSNIDDAFTFTQVETKEVTATSNINPEELVFTLNGAEFNVSSNAVFRAYFYGSGTNYFQFGDADNASIQGLTVEGTAIPEAQTCLLFLCGVIGIAVYASKNKKS